MEPTYRQCPFCSRKYDLEGWRKLELQGFHEFGTNFLELRICRCKVLVSVEHVLRVEVKALPPYNTHVRFTGNKR